MRPCSRVAAAAALAAIACAPAFSAEAATLRFSGGASGPPTDYVSYMRHAFCETLPPGGWARDRGCRAVMRWMAENAGKNPAAWSPAPLFR